MKGKLLWDKSKSKSFFEFIGKELFEFGLLKSVSSNPITYVIYPGSAEKLIHATTSWLVLQFIMPCLLIQLGVWSNRESLALLCLDETSL